MMYLLAFLYLMLMTAVAVFVALKLPAKLRLPAVLAIYAAFAIGAFQMYDNHVHAQQMAYARLHWNEPLDGFTPMTVGDLVSGRCVYFDPDGGNMRVVCGDHAKAVRARYEPSCFVVQKNGLHICRYAPAEQTQQDDQPCTNHDPIYGNCHD